MRSFTHLDAGMPAARWAAVLADRAPAPFPLTTVQRLIVVAAHPDDETLGAGGLIACAAAQGIPTRILVATAGEGSHPGSPTVTATQLARRRREELVDAASALGVPESDVIALQIPDGHVGDNLDAITATIVDLVGDGRDAFLVAPFRGDGHPDHEAMGRCAAAAAHRTGAVLAEYPIWFWHAGTPQDLPSGGLVRLELPTDVRSAKYAAIDCHRSQVQPLSDQPGDETLLPETVLAHFVGGAEHFVLTDPQDAPDGRLDRLHAGDDDPWGTQSRWYEERKRSLLLAMLPRRTFDRVLEVGCSTGMLAEALSHRACALTALDSSAAALSRARTRLPQADLRLMAVPDQWPEGSFDLIVVSEVGYFLSPDQLDRLVRRVETTLCPDGFLVLCHWRHPVRGWPLTAAQVHDRFAGSEVLAGPAASYRDRDVEIVIHGRPDQWPAANA